MLITYFTYSSSTSELQLLTVKYQIASFMGTVTAPAFCWYGQHVLAVVRHTEPLVFGSLNLGVLIRIFNNGYFSYTQACLRHQWR